LLKALAVAVVLERLEQALEAQGLPERSNVRRNSDTGIADRSRSDESKPTLDHPSWTRAIIPFAEERITVLIVHSALQRFLDCPDFVHATWSA
jgi:hypothetical protein